MAKFDYIIPTTKNIFAFVLIFSFLLCLTLFSFLFSGFIFVKMNNYTRAPPVNSIKPSCTSTTCAPPVNATKPSCTGRYIYIQKLPERFHTGLLRECRNLSRWTDMCQKITNYGFGPRLNDTDGTLVPTDAWYNNDQFTLEIIFHNRMKQYDCLTEYSPEAAAVYVPYYTALDIGRHLWGQTVSVRDALMYEMLQWLRSSPEWAVRDGRDHFVVVGRPTWDMQRSEDEDSHWGGKFMVVPETKNMTVLILEANIWNGNEFGIPYPSYFHPSSMSDIITWQEKIRHVKRAYLFSFSGARRKNHSSSAIRDQVMDQCLESPRCKLFECGSFGGKCRSPVSVMSLFQSSIFCIQPRGDSFTRRSTFDSMLAGCIPVFFNQESAHKQYKWHLPRNHTKYSVYMPEDAVINGTVKIADVLLGYSAEKIKEMREEVINMIPSLIYNDPRYRLNGVRDAFDIAVDSVLERMRRIRNEPVL